MLFSGILKAALLLLINKSINQCREIPGCLLLYLQILFLPFSSLSTENDLFGLIKCFYSLCLVARFLNVQEKRLKSGF